jgi:hypothetical protein
MLNRRGNTNRQLMMAKAHKMPSGHPPTAAKILIARICIVAVLCVTTGCGSGGGTTTQSSSTSPTSNPNVSGNWQVTLNSSLASSPPQNAFGLYLSQNGESLTAAIASQSDYCALPFPVPLVGTFQSNQLSLAMGPSQTNNVSVSAQLASDGKSLSGTFSILNQSTTCPQDHGTVTGTLVPSLGGQWSGTGVSRTGANVQLSVTLTAGSPDSFGFPLLSGNATVHAPCFSNSSGTFEGDQRGLFIAGPPSTASDAGSVAQITEGPNGGNIQSYMSLATALSPPPTSNSMSFTYFTTCPNGSTDSGTVSMSLQP